MKEDSRRRFPLSDVQRAYYLGRCEEFELGGYSTHICYRFKTTLNPVKLEYAMNRVIARQEMLRVLIKNENEQEIIENVEQFKIKMYDLSSTSQEEASKQLDEIERKLFTKKIDPGIWPQYEFLYASMPDGTNYLIMSFDMLVADSSSLLLIAQELKKIYENGKVALNELKSSYADYIRATEERKRSPKYQKDKTYWQEKINEIYAAPKLPKADTHNTDIIIKRKIFELPTEEWKTLKTMALEQNITPTGIVLAAYVKVLGQWSENKDFTVNLTLSERGRYREMSLVGDYTTAMLVSFESENYENRSLFSIAKTVVKKIIQAYKHNTYNGIEVMRDISKERNLGTQAVMPIVFTSMLFKEEAFEILDFFGTLDKGISQTPQVILDCQAMEYHGNLLITWDYAEGYIDTKVLEQMKGQMLKVLRNPYEVDTKKLFPLSSEDEQLWKKYNNTVTKNYENNRRNLLSFLCDGFKNHLENIAVEGINESITYAELWVQSEFVLRNLKEEHIGFGDCVCVIARRDISTIINILGIIRSGAAYVPILEEYPFERITYIEKKCDSKKTLKPFGWEPLGVIPLIEENENSNNRCEQAAYVIFTSGSTGTPKGVVITNEAVVNTITEINRLLNVTENDVFLGVSSLCFDLSVYDMFGCFGAGAKLVLIENPKEPEKVLQKVIEQKVTIWNSVPALAQLVFDNNIIGKGKKIESFVRYFMISGDWIPLGLPEHLLEKCSGAEVISLGGATEASIWSIWYPIKNIEDSWNSIPYGRPLPNQKIYVLDKNEMLCPAEVVGEICIGGVGVAAGYLNDEEKTNAQFTKHDEFGRIYHSGDYGVLHRKSMQVEFLGRKDSQVKINGFRIETGEIENAILNIHGIKDVQVVVDGEKFKQIFAFYIGYAELTEIKIREELEKKLPLYMIPASIEKIDKFPLMANEKVDRKKLLMMAKEKKVLSSAATKQEEMIIELWSQVLGLPKEEIGCNRNFFALGGDSIKAIQILSLLKKAGYTVEMKELYTHATVSRLATVLKQEEKRREYIPVEGTFELTPSQKWFFEKIHQGREQFNQWISLKWKGRLNKELIKETLRYLVKYHDTLRITLRKIDGKYINEYGKPENPDNYFYFSEVKSTRDEKEESQKLQQRFDLENGALIAVVLFHGEDNDTLRLIIHHLLTDGVSFRILLSDFCEIYRSLEVGETPRMCQSTVSYIEWEQEVNSEVNKVTKEELAYWKEICREGKVLNSKLFNQKSGKYSSCRTKIIELPMPVQGGFSSEELVLANYIRALQDAIECHGLMVEVEYHGRDERQCEKDISHTIGWFSYSYPIVIKGLNFQSGIEDIISSAMREVPLKGKNFSLLRSIGTFGKEKTLIHFNYLGNLDAINYDEKIIEMDVGQDMNSKCNAIAIMQVVAYEKGGILTYKLTFDETVTGTTLLERVAENIQSSKNEDELDLILNQLYE